MDSIYLPYLIFPLIIFVIIPGVYGLYKALHAHVTKSEVEELIDLKLDALKVIQAAQKEMLIDFKESMKDLDYKLDMLIQYFTYNKPPPNGRGHD